MGRFTWPPERGPSLDPHGGWWTTYHASVRAAAVGLCLMLGGCRAGVPAEVPAVALVETPVRVGAPPVEAAPDTPTPSALSLDEASDWLGLYRKLETALVARQYQFEDAPATESEARDWLCTDAAETPICLGHAPWVVQMYGDGQWAFFAVTQRDGRWIHSEVFGEGGISRCEASTQAVIEAGPEGIGIRLEDTIGFTDLYCEDCEAGHEEDPEFCECQSYCAESVTTTCLIPLDPESLELGEPDAACNAYLVGAAQGLEI